MGFFLCYHDFTIGTKTLHIINQIILRLGHRENFISKSLQSVPKNKNLDAKS
jgi:hypothetical protein